MSLPILNELQLEYFLAKNNGTVLLDFYADWCGPCKMLSPILEKINHEKEDTQIVKINIDDCPNLVQKYNIEGVPTMIILKNNEVQNVSVGAIPEEKILELLV